MKWHAKREGTCALCATQSDGLARTDTGAMVCFDCAYDVIRVINAAIKKREKRIAALN